MNDVFMTFGQMKDAAKKLRRAARFVPKKIRDKMILDAYDLERGIIPGTPESARAKRQKK